jgi:hypothetical protein
LKQRKGRKKMQILKSENKGNTFNGLIMTAFDLKNQRSIKADTFAQLDGMGTIEVDGKAYDWFDRGDSVVFAAAE